MLEELKYTSIGKVSMGENAENLKIYIGWLANFNLIISCVNMDPLYLPQTIEVLLYYTDLMICNN